jgi:hypothetical protein
MPNVGLNTNMFGVLLVAVVASYEYDDINAEDVTEMKTCIADKCQPLLQECTTEISRCFAEMYLMLEEDTAASTQQITFETPFACVPTAWDNDRGDFCDPTQTNICEDGTKKNCDGRGVYCYDKDAENDSRCKQENVTSETFDSITRCAYCNGCLDHRPDMKSEWPVAKQGANCWPNCDDSHRIKANQSMCPALVDTPGDALGDAPVVVFGVAVLGIVVLALSLLFT